MSEFHTASRAARLLFVHAHPDDETLATGVSLAHYARIGAEVHLLTCTLGDEGEVIPPELAHHLSANDDTLGPFRRGELRSAVSELGVLERVLGEDPQARAGALYRDSGMAGTDENNDPRALCRASQEEVAAHIADHIAALRPDAVVTYEASGGYGHPDHIRVHDATRAALATMSADERPAMFVVLTPADVAAEDRTWVQRNVPALVQAARDAGGLTEQENEALARVLIPEADDPYPPSVVAPELATHVVEGTPEDLRARDAALRHHRTQVTLYDGWYTLSNDIATRLARAEYFARMDPVTGNLLAAPASDAPGRTLGILP